MGTHDYDPEGQNRRHGQAAERKEIEKPDQSRPFGPGWTRGVDHASVARLQRSAGNASTASALSDEAEEERSPIRDIVDSGGGSPLEPSTRKLMESRFGEDFADVRIHTDGQASESARSVQANAYTVGTDVVFQGDNYAPGTDEGQRMLAHELTHVVQQRAGPVAGTTAQGGIKISDPGDPFEQAAERTADQVMSRTGPPPQLGSASQGERGSMQRQGAPEAPEEQEEAQGSFVQRQAPTSEGEEPETG